MARSNWAFVIRHSSFLILAVASCSFFYPAPIRAATAPDGSASVLSSSPSIDGLDCVTAYDASDETLQITDNSSDPWNDFDEISLPIDDKAVLPSRFQQHTPYLTTTSCDAVTLRRLGTVPNLLLSAHSFYSLREHLRERAPPSLV
jgi:hypothetical protein